MDLNIKLQGEKLWPWVKKKGFLDKIPKNVS